MLFTFTALYSGTGSTYYRASDRGEVTSARVRRDLGLPADAAVTNTQVRRWVMRHFSPDLEWESHDSEYPDEQECDEVDIEEAEPEDDEEEEEVVPPPPPPPAPLYLYAHNEACPCEECEKNRAWSLIPVQVATTGKSSTGIYNQEEDDDDDDDDDDPDDDDDDE